MKMRILSKKTLAIFLSLTMLLSCMVWSGVSAATTTDLSYDFETDPTGSYYKATSSGNNDNVYADDMRAELVTDLEEGFAHSGTGAMKMSWINTEAHNNTNRGPAFRIASTAKTSYAPTNGALFKVSFWYYVESISADLDIRVLTASRSWAGTSSAAVNDLASIKASYSEFVAVELSKDTAETGKWKYASVEFQSTYDRMHFAMHAPNGVAPTVVYIDDLTVEKYSDTFTVEVKTNGATTADYQATVADGYTYTPATPTRANHSFTGWYTDAACTEPYSGVVTTDISALYAGWKAEAIHELSFDDASASTYYDYNNVSYDRLAVDGHVDAEKELPQVMGIHGGLEAEDGRGNVLYLEYYDPATNTDERDQTVNVVSQAGFRITNNKGSGVTLAPGAYAVTFDYKAENVTDELPLTFSIGSRNWASKAWNYSGKGVSNGERELGEAMLLADTDGWASATLGVVRTGSNQGAHLHINKTESGAAFAGTKLSIDNVKIYPGSAVTMVYNDGETADTTRYVASGTAFDAAAPTRPAYDFVGWYIDADCTVPATTWAAGATYYAGWTVKATASYIAFDCGDVTTVDTIVGEAGTAATLPTGVTVKGYRLEGWYTDVTLETPATDVVFPGADETTTLYAKWIPTAEVSFSTGLGSAVAAQTVDVGATTTAPTAPTRPNYVFDGWYVDDTCQTAFDFATIIEADTTLYAKWVANYKTYSTGNVMTFQETDDLSYYEYDTKEATSSKRTASIDADEDGNKALRYDLTATANNGNFDRPRVVVKTGDARANDNLVVTPGAAYEVTFKVKSAAAMSNTFNYWVATVNDLTLFETDYGSGTTAENAGARKIQKESSATLEADNWTTFKVTIDSLVACGDASTPQYLAIGFTHTGTTDLTARTLWIDDITVTRTDVSLEPSTEMGTMDFESTGGKEYYSVTQNGAKFTEVVSDPADFTNHVLRLNIAKGINGNFARHRVALQPGDAAENGVYSVNAGDAVVVSFRVKVSKAMNKFTYWVGTMTDLTMLHTDTSTSGAANAYRTMQVGYQVGDMALKYSKDGDPAAAGTANEYYLGALEADTWYEYKLYIPSVVAHGDDDTATQYLVLATGSQDVTPTADDSWLNQAIYLDDITVTTLQDAAALENEVAAWMQADTNYGTTDTSLVFEVDDGNGGKVQKSFVRLGAKYVTDDADGFTTLKLGNTSYEIVQRGILLGEQGADLHVVKNEDGTYDKSADAIGWTNPTDMSAKYWQYNEETKQVSYTLAVTFSAQSKETALAFRAYMIVMINGVETVLYTDTVDSVTVGGATKALSGQSLYESACELNGTTYGWFTE